MDARSAPPSPPKFEDAYRQYEFAPLVTLALMIGQWIKAHFPDRPPWHGAPAGGGSSRAAHSGR